MSNFTKRRELQESADEVWAWHTRPGALQRLSPPFEAAEVEEQFENMHLGAQTILKVGVGPLKLRWVANITGFEPPSMFQDTQVSGPFSNWVHTHRFISTGPHKSILEDSVEYQLPMGALGKLGGDLPIRKKIERMFTYRHQITEMDLERHRAFREAPRMTVAISGASGMIGSALTAFLTTGGHTVRRLSRSKSAAQAGDIFWDPATGAIDSTAMEGLDAVVHLAGESVAGGRWTEEKKEKILNSRVKGTDLLATTCAKLAKPPAVFISSSAIGYYGSRGEEILDETSTPGTGFLADVCQAWEKPARALSDRGVRLVTARIGVVLSSAGGALKTMLLPFQVGAGGPVGTGKQWMSWVSLEDVLFALYFALNRKDVSGLVNLVAPEAVRQKDFARTLGKILSRPAWVPLPQTAVRLAFGEMGEEVLLASQRVVPKALQAAGFVFAQPHLEQALRMTLGKIEP